MELLLEWERLLGLIWYKITGISNIFTGGGLSLNLASSEYGGPAAPRGSPTPRVTFADEPQM